MTTIDIDTLRTVTGGYHDAPEPKNQGPAAPTQTCKVGEPHPKTFEERFGELAKRVAPWIQLFDR